MPAQSRPSPYILFEEQQPSIDRALEMQIRRRCLPPEEADELRSFAYRRLIDNDCSILAKYRGESSWATYLTVVMAHLYLDFCNHRWGKWRPCARARRLGESGVLVDQLVRRDGLGAEEAVALASSHQPATASIEDLRRLARDLPLPVRPPLAGDDALARCASARRADTPLLEAEREQRLGRIEDHLRRALQSLPAEDRLVVRMRFVDGFQVSEIARVLGLQQKPLYRRIQGLLTRLRRQLEAAGCTAQEVSGLLDR